MRRILIIFFLFVACISINETYAQMKLSLQAGLQMPTGDFADGAGLGFGANATFEYLQSSPLSFTALIGYNSFGAEDELPEGRDLSFTSIPILVGARYYLARGNYHPYLGVELGVHFLSTKFSRTEGNTTVTVESSSSEFGLTPMAGFRYHVSPTVDLDINLKYNIITTEGSSTSFMGINGGVQFAL
jgi:outer membrane protein W